MARFVAPDSVYLWALLGGCNCKVPTEVCELLLSLVCGLYQHCRQQTLELIGPVVERVAFFLSQATATRNSCDTTSLSFGARNH